MSNNDFCAICYDNIKPPVGILNCCPHRFCFHCILTWTKSNASCPLDRQTITSVRLAETVNSSEYSEPIPIRVKRPVIVGRLSIERAAMATPLRQFVEANINLKSPDSICHHVHNIYGLFSELHRMELMANGTSNEDLEELRRYRRQNARILKYINMATEKAQMLLQLTSHPSYPAELRNRLAFVIEHLERNRVRLSSI